MNRSGFLSLLLIITTFSIMSGELQLVYAGVPTITAQSSIRHPAPANSTVTLSVTVSNISPSQPLAGWTVYLWTDNSILTPVGFALGSFIPDATVQTLCISDVADSNFQGSCTGFDGPGIVHSEAYSSTGSTSYGNGTLFTMTYKVLSGPGTLAYVFQDSLFDFLGNPIAHAVIQGSYGNLGRPNFRMAAGSPFNLGPLIIDGISVNATNSFVGTVNLTVIAPPGVATFLSPSPQVDLTPPTRVGVALLNAIANSPGTYTITIIGTSGSLSHKLTTTLTFA